MRYVPAMDGTGLRAFRTNIRKLRRDQVHVLLTGVQPQPMKVLFESGLAEEIGLDNFCGDVDEALARCRTLLGG
jgi:SulP family sulfate permease